MSYRIPVNPASVLSDEGIWDLAPVPAARTVRFADTPVDFIAEKDSIRLRRDNDKEFRPVEGRIYH